MKIESFGMTDVGRKRAHNEDSLGISDELRLYLVADGMGGHNAGEVASSTAVETIQQFIRRCHEDKDFTWPFGINPNISEEANILLTAIRIANRNVCVRAGERYDYSGMGTTIVAAYMEEEAILHIAHVGDSRAYIIRNDEIRQITLDHSWVNEQIQKRVLTQQDARNHRWKNVITRALGNKLNVDIDLASLKMQNGDYIIVCTDGLTSMLDDSEVLKTIKDVDGRLDKACKNLIKAANEKGGLDNITVILLKFKE
ncbi:MAG: Serine/threonine phosphatase stp [candidate division BRC1 bacterium ADurb.Bin183]|nr:MAG: Serine/threonine phosphatase stp [candidate division BRC1 bacterium ADurb.Bin183]